MNSRAQAHITPWTQIIVIGVLLLGIIPPAYILIRWVDSRITVEWLLYFAALAITGATAWMTIKAYRTTQEPQ